MDGTVFLLGAAWRCEEFVSSRESKHKTSLRAPGSQPKDRQVLPRQPLWNCSRTDGVDATVCDS